MGEVGRAVDTASCPSVDARVLAYWGGRGAKVIGAAESLCGLVSAAFVVALEA